MSLEQNENSRLYQFMQVATIVGMGNLEKLTDIKLTYESAETHLRKKQRKC